MNVMRRYIPYVLPLGIAAGQYLLNSGLNVQTKSSPLNHGFDIDATCIRRFGVLMTLTLKSENEKIGLAAAESLARHPFVGLLRLTKKSGVTDIVYDFSSVVRVVRDVSDRIMTDGSPKSVRVGSDN